MPFIPHTPEDVATMLEAIDAPSIEALFDEIPTHLRINELPEMPASLSAMALLRAMQARAELDKVNLNFIGAGAYEHHIPAAVWDIASRGEFMTAYTPYQAEASQGTLQLLYEYQTMMANLMAMDVSNASLYDGASALAEAILMAIRIKGSHQILLPTTVHPFYRQVVKTLVEPLGCELIELPFCLTTGKTLVQDLEAYTKCAALVIPQPNFLGVLEDVHILTDWAHTQGALVIGVVNPIAMGLFSPPGEWGTTGADIACGEGQPFGVPMASGGPYFGFFCCKKDYIRQMPGRLIGRTRDAAGKMGFTLTLQAREQHIRRAKAKSNICTNQGLLVTAATIFMSLTGAKGLYNIASACYAHTKALSELLLPLEKSEGISVVFKQGFFHELVLRFPCSVEKIIQALAKQGIQAGFDLTPVYKELGSCLLVCVTETKTQDDLIAFVSALKAVMTKEAKVCQGVN
jgi:glycine dehydrogenase subunit 1